MLYYIQPSEDVCWGIRNVKSLIKVFFTTCADCFCHVCSRSLYIIFKQNKVNFLAILFLFCGIYFSRTDENSAKFAKTLDPPKISCHTVGSITSHCSGMQPAIVDPIRECTPKVTLTVKKVGALRHEHPQVGTLASPNFPYGSFS